MKAAGFRIELQGYPDPAIRVGSYDDAKSRCASRASMPHLLLRTIRQTAQRCCSAVRENADAAALVKAIGAQDASQRTAQQRRCSCAKETIRSSNRSLFGSRIASLPSPGANAILNELKRTALCGSDFDGGSWLNDLGRCGSSPRSTFRKPSRRLLTSRRKQKKAALNRD